MGIAPFPTFVCENKGVQAFVFFGTCEMAGQEFQILKDIVQPDSRGRLSIGAVTKGKSYRISINAAGQILLDPVVAVPERELWLWQNPDAIATVQRGIEQAATGNLHDMGSFAEYAELEVED